MAKEKKNKKGKDAHFHGDMPPDVVKVEPKIVKIDIVPEMKTSYLDYAMSVIVSRALPDVRDGLKPVHRRILFSMYDLGLTASAKFRKSAMIVGDVLGKYHPHGDSAVYDAMVNLAQNFKTRYPLVFGQGNFGSIDGDSAAAYRYTEAKMAKITSEILGDLEKDTVDFIPNFDNTRKEPSVFPSAIPTLLLNGTLGIAVGMATKIPPHNLGEIMDALIHLADNGDATTEDLFKFIKGPDFPTGGIVFNEKDILRASATGRGGVVVRGEAEIVEAKSGSAQIIISSIPYQVNKSEMIIKMADLVKEKKIEGIRDIRDESTEDIRIVIDLKSGTYPEQILNALYKYTDLEQTFNYNMLALVEGIPKTLSVKNILEEFIAHRKIVVKRRTQFDLRKAEEREHILLGLSKALDHIDEVIKIIKKSKDTADAALNLIKTFKFSEIQAAAILDMKLQKLAGLERKKIEDELNAIQALIKELKALLASNAKILQVIKNEFSAIKEKYADERKTKVMKRGVTDISVEDLIPDDENVLVLTSGGYIKRTDPGEYRAQRRGGVGVVDLNTKEEDFITIFLTASNHSDLLFFTDKGKAYQIKMYDIPEGKRATRGKSIMNFLSLADDERVTSVLAMPKEVKNQKSSLLMITKMGVVKKVSTDSFKDVRRSGIIAIKLQDGDELMTTKFVETGDSIILITAGGQSVRFKESDAREMGRAAAGVRAVKLKKKDAVVGADVIKKDDKESKLLVMSEHGFGKMTKIKEYKIQKRGGSGIKTAKVTAKTGQLMVGKVITEAEEELIAISKNAQVIRINIGEVPVLGRQTQGVRIMRLREDDSIASLTCL
ncbi:MAG: gyrase subunit A protein [Parcubacteria group bacterium GW2011_GWF2_38_76]|nr:MAG: gyrase subunit A protein [Parcubacteria group bacterium GW2011_GWF2_38_76]